MTATWMHTDERTAPVAAAAGLRRANALDWTTGPLSVRVADFHGYLLAHCWAETAIGGGTVRAEERGFQVILPSVENLPNTERARVLRALRRTADALAAEDPGFAVWTPPVAILTNARAGGEVAGLPAVAVVAVAVSAAAAIGYLAHQAAQVVDNYLARKHQLAQVVQADAQVVSLVTQHTDREREAGHALPLDAATTRALDALEARQRDLAKATTPPIGSGLPKSPILSFTAGAAFSAAALALGAVWLLSK